MTKTIGNPASWTARILGLTGREVAHAVDRVGSHDLTVPTVHELSLADIREALVAGWDDFIALRSDVVALVLIYPILGLALTGMAFNMNYLPLLFPMAAGFALLGPVAAIGMYEMSRRREAGEAANWSDALLALRSGIFGPVVVLAFYLGMIFLLWLYAANLIFRWTLGPETPTSISAFIGDVFTTPAGITMLIVGMGVGAVFAALVLVTALVSFPMLIDRRAGLPVSVSTSIAVARKNPTVVAAWGLVVAGLLALGSIPIFLGLVIVLPVLGHATWHFYRAAVS